MTKRLILTSALCLFTMLQTTFAQFQLENAGFEEWESNTLPKGWNTYETVTGDFANTAKSSNQCKQGVGHSGNFSMVAVSREINAFITKVIANGIVTSGVINAGSMTATNSNNNNQTVAGDDAKSMSFKGRPDSVVAWIKAVPKSSSHFGRFYVILHDNCNFQDPGGDWSNVYAVAGVNPPASSGWVRYSCPFFYAEQTHDVVSQKDEKTEFYHTPKRKISGNDRPSYVLATISTNYKAAVGSAGDEIYVDDIEMIYNSQLTSVAIDGTNVEGFSKDVYAYNVAGKYTKGAVTHESNGRYATVEESYNETNKTLTLTVKGDNYSADNTNKHVYTFTFGCDAKLNNFKIDGNQLTDFSSDKFDYTINRVYENVKSKISYEASSCARVTETWDEENNKLSITVAGDDTKVYTFQFHAPYGSQLKTFTIAGKSINGFAADKYDYSVANTYNADKIKYSADEGATIEEKFNSETLTLTITVKGGDFAENTSNTHTYTIKFHAPYGSVLTELNIDGASVKNFASSTPLYTTAKVYKEGTTKITYKASSEAIVSESFDEKTLVYTIVVKGGDIAENATNTHTYTIQFHAPYGSHLKSLTIGGKAVDGFSPTQYAYNINKTYDKDQLAFTVDEEATYETSFNKNTLELTIIVKGGDIDVNASNTHKYIIQYHAPYEAKLTQLNIDGEKISGFNQSTFAYNSAKVYKEGTTKVTYTASDEATVTESFDAKTLVYTLVVKGGNIAENPDNTNTYTIQFHAPYGSQLKSISIAGKAIDGFSPRTYEYTVANSYKESQFECEADEEAKVEKKFNEETYKLTVTVKGGDIAENPTNVNTYIIQYHAPYESFLTDLSINGETISEFSSTKYNYSVQYVYAEGLVSYKKSVDAVVEENYNAENQTYTIIVKGGDFAENTKNIHTYTINFHDSYGSQLKSLTVNLNSVANFAADKYEYIVEDYYEDGKVKYTLDDTEASATERFDATTNKLEIVVKGGDYEFNNSNTHTYTLQFWAKSLLTNISYNGNTVPAFRQDKYEYRLTEYAYEEEKITYTVAEGATANTKYDAENNTLEIEVIGSDIDRFPKNKHTYKVVFRQPSGSYLTSIRVNETELESFNKTTFNYLIKENYKSGMIEYTQDENASVSTNFKEETNQYVIVVKGDDYDSNPTNTHTYTLQFYAPSTLSSIRVNNVNIAGFEEDKYEYVLNNIVYKNANIIIKEADNATVEKIFDVKVESVNTINVKPRKKRVGRYAGLTNRKKKAIVTLKEGSSIELN